MDNDEVEKEVSRIVKYKDIDEIIEKIRASSETTQNIIVVSIPEGEGDLIIDHTGLPYSVLYFFLGIAMSVVMEDYHQGGELD